jgi:hypothetical protein
MKKYIPNIGDLVEVECPVYKTTAIGIITNITVSKLTRKFIKDDIKEVIKSLGCENLTYKIFMTERFSLKIMKTYKSNISSSVEFLYDDFRLVQKIN